MKNSRFLAAITVWLLAFSLVACHTIEPEPEPEPEPVREVDPPINEPAVLLHERIEDGRIVAAYVTYYGSQVPEALSITHINYAFAEPYLEDGVYKIRLQGTLSRFESVIAIKKLYPYIKICLSFTGGIFSNLCKSEANRKAFADSCLVFLQKYNLDGIDLDWEYPGRGSASDPSCDVDNYVLLVKQLRETFGDKYIISYAGYCIDKVKVTDEDGVQVGWRYIDIKAMDPYVDYVNIMTYELDAAPKHHSALNDPRANKDCKRSVDAYLNAGVAPSKLVLGIPFFGRHSWNPESIAISYKNILTLDPYQYRRNKWDEQASCPYVEKMNGEFYCGYDNPRSIAIKGEWARKLGLRGLMFWEYDQDDSRGTLRHAVWNAVMTQ